MLTKDRLIQLVRDGASLSLIIRESVSETISEALLIEAQLFIEQNQELLGGGQRRLVLNGNRKPRDVTFTFGHVPVTAPRVRDMKDGDRKLEFKSNMLPPYLRRSREMDSLIPWLYLSGVPEADFQPIFDSVCGFPVKNLSQSSISRLLDGWSEDFEAWDNRDMSVERYPYVWADGVNFGVATDKHNACELVLLEVGEDGRKRLLAIGEGYAENAACWQELFTKLKRQGMAAPLLTIGDGGQGLWGGLTRVFPDCVRQYCWVHKLRDLQRNLPKERHAEVTSKARDIFMSETREAAARKLELLAEGLGIKHRQAAETLTKYADGLLGFYDFPAQHWQNLRTTNPIESMFSTVRLRMGKTRGRVSRERLGGLLLKLAQTATANMNALPHADKIGALLAGAVFKDGIPEE